MKAKEKKKLNLSARNVYLNQFLCEDGLLCNAVMSPAQDEMN